jgi:FHS family L-fucose permease-like MFS transporter
MTDKTAKLIPPALVLPFILVTSLFALWGFANDITNPMVAAFKNILLISNFESSLVQFAFYGGYCVMAFPAALFIKKFSYKSGILLGLALYAIGCILFIPSGWLMAFWAFLLSYFIMTCGLSFLETSSNPYILAMGDEATATRRLNFAQSFNPMGSLTGMLVARNLILCKLDPMTEDARRELLKSTPEAFSNIAKHDLTVIIWPYAVLGIVVALFFIVFFFTRLPRSTHDDNRDLSLGATLSRLGKNHNYIWGVVAQSFYVGAQIMCWTFIIQYAEAEIGMSKADGQFYNMIAMGMFVCSRFVCTFLLKYVNPGALLAVLATIGTALIAGTIFLPGMPGLYCLVASSATMSLMFPTIYGIALEGLGDDAKLGAAGLIMAIGGGCLMPPLQGWIMDQSAFNLLFTTLSSVRMSFTLPLICFVVVALYGLKTYFHAKKGASSC